MIRIEGLTKHFGQVVALDGLNLVVPRGELFCFLGPNGAGKTTTIKILTGLLRPTSGRAEICGVDILADPVAAKRKIGYIPDMPYLYDRLTPVEYMRFVADLYRMPPGRAAERTGSLLSLFGLEEQRASMIRNLSHGMRQRLLYCANLLHDPEVLFIDEPLIGLDPHSIRLIKNLLKAKSRAGMTIFLTTHILALAEDVADRIGIVEDGRLKALGTMEELRAAHGGGTLEDIFLVLTGGADAGAMEDLG